jgi:hypothetical protein
MDMATVEDSRLRLSEREIVDLTEYDQPARQLAELHRQGFFRARIGRTGRVVLERAHYEAVCRGMASTPERKPRVRAPTRGSA